MKKINIIYSLLLSLMLIPSCKNEEIYSNLIQLKFDYNQLVDDFDYTELTDSFIEIIPLETKAECLIAKIAKIEITDQYIFIKDDLAKSVFMFDKNGHFIDKINAVGQGPGEYICLFDKYERKTIIIPRFNTKMGRFDDFYFSIDRVIDNKLICFMDVNNLLLVNQYDYQDKQFSNKAFEKKIKCVINSLKEDDNPVLFIFKFKD